MAPGDSHLIKFVINPSSIQTITVTTAFDGTQTKTSTTGVFDFYIDGQAVDRDITISATGYEDFVIPANTISWGNLDPYNPEYTVTLTEDIIPGGNRMASNKILVHLNMNGNEIQNVLAHKLATAPSNPSAGQFYYNTSENILYVYNGTSWINAMSQGKIYSEGTGIDITNDVISVDLSASDIPNLASSKITAMTGYAKASAVAAITESDSLNTAVGKLEKGLDSKVDANSAITAATKCKITYDTKGLVTAGADLQASDIPNLTSTKINSLADYTKGSTNAAIASTDTLNQALSKLENQIDAKVSGNTAITGATKCKITYDSKGLVTSGADLSTTDIPDLSATYIATTQKGAASGVATLDSSSLVPVAQLPAATTSVKGAVIVDDTITSDSTNPVQSGAIYTALSNKQATITGAATTIVSSDLTASKALVSNSSGKVAVSDTTATELGYVHGVTSSIQDQIDTLSGRGRFLSLWNCSTGLPTTNPGSLPYTYKTGDFYIVGTVGTTNYKPSGSSYSGTASTATESATVAVNDTYYYDGTNWILQVNTERTVTFSSITGQPTDNTNLATALNAKADLASPALTGTPTAPTATTGTNTTQIATTQFVQTAIATASLTIAEDNPALTSSGGACTWTITNSLNNADVQCIVREKSSGEEVYPQKTYTASTITIKINSSTNISAETYRAVVIGQKKSSNVYLT